MNIMVTFRHMSASDALRKYAEQKAEKTTKYLIEPIDVHIILMVEKNRKVVEMNVQSRSFTAHSIEESQDMYASIDKVIAKIEAQLRKHKEKVKEHKSDGKAYDALEAATTVTE